MMSVLFFLSTLQRTFSMPADMEVIITYTQKVKNHLNFTGLFNSFVNYAMADDVITEHFIK